MSLYVPTKQEIDHAVAAAAALAPALWSRLLDAGSILREGELAWSEDGWHCLDTGHGTLDPARIHAVRFDACTCDDYRRGGAAVHGEVFCPHRLALLLYCDICLAHGAARRLGLTKDPRARAAARAVPYAGLLLMRYDAGRKLALVTAKPHCIAHCPICQMAKVDGGLGFASEQDLAVFATWLAKAPALAPPPARPAEEDRLRLPRVSAPVAAHLAALLV
jgi:hypothetical protein